MICHKHKDYPQIVSFDVHFVDGGHGKKRFVTVGKSHLINRETSAVIAIRNCKKEGLWASG